MPLVRIDLVRGKSPAYCRALADGVYEAMRETINVPEDDRFIVVSEHDAHGLSFAPSYLGIPHTRDMVFVQITLRRGRSVEAKQALYRAIVARLGAAPGLAPSDVFITLVENGPEDWSFGNGEAQYVK